MESSLVLWWCVLEEDNHYNDRDPRVSGAIGSDFLLQPIYYLDYRVLIRKPTNFKDLLSGLKIAFYVKTSFVFVSSVELGH